MPVELIVPSVGESISEVEIGDWLKSEGEPVEQDGPVVVIETEKASVELPAPTAGTITSMLKHKGEKAAVGDVIGYMEPGGRSAKPKPSSSGNGRRSEEPPAERHNPPAPEPDAKAPPVIPAASTGREEQIVPMTPIRRRIAERLVEAQNTAALLTTFNQADMSAVMALRKQHQEAFQARHGIKLGFMSFFVKASIEALRQIPQINAEVRGHDIVYRNYYDIGIAVGGNDLVVPLLRHADRLMFAEIVE